MAARAYERDGHSRGIATRHCAISTRRWAACSIRTSSSSRAAPAWARRRSRPTSPSTSPGPTRGETRPDGAMQTVERRHRRLLLARNVVRTAGDPHHRRAVGRRLLQDPPRRHHRGRVSSQSRRRGRRDAADPLLHRPDRRHLDRAAYRARAAAQAPARPRPAGGRLSATAVGLEVEAATTACRS